MPADWARRVRCLDASGRPAEVVVTMRDRPLSITAPAGSVVVFGAKQLEELEVLCNAVSVGIQELTEERWRS